MKILPSDILQSGAGIDLSDLADGVSVRLADPAEGFAAARNAVTLVFDLTDCQQVHLAFEAKEYGDEPHAPPAGPFGADVAFDGVAVSTDGASWYEVQDLRHLRSDRFTTYDLDLDAAVAPWDLAYGPAFQVRFCQYDNNPAPMDGIFLHRITLTAELPAAVLHLPLDDYWPSPTVRDLAAGGQDQTFIDPTGDPNTAAHSVPGPNDTRALAFDGVDDRIDFGPELLGDIVGADCDFSLAFSLRVESDPGAVSKYILRRAGTNTEPYLKVYLNSGGIRWQVRWSDTGCVTLTSPAGLLDGQWHHILCRRRGDTLSLWIVGALADTETGPDYTKTFFAAWDDRAIGQVYGTDASDWPFALADFRAYNRALRDEEIAGLSNLEG